MLNRFVGSRQSGLVSFKAVTPVGGAILRTASIHIQDVLKDFVGRRNCGLGSSRAGPPHGMVKAWEARVVSERLTVYNMFLRVSSVHQIAVSG